MYTVAYINGPETLLVPTTHVHAGYNFLTQVA